MIHLDSGTKTLPPAEQYGLGVLVDLSRLLPVDDPAAPVVRLQIEDTGRGVEAAGDGKVTVSRALLRQVAEVGGAAVEQRSMARDRYGRVPTSAHPLAGVPASEQLLVSNASAALRRAAIAVAGARPLLLLAPWPDGRRWAAALTHDLDIVDWWPAFTLLRTVELLRRGEVGVAGRVAGAAIRGAFADPVAEGVRHLLAIEAGQGVRATWFILSGDPTLQSLRAGDLSYRPEGRRARAIVAAVDAGGHEIGLHGSFATCEDADRFRLERERLARLTAQPVHGVRQHFLRMRPGATQRAMRTAGFHYDASYGFPDRGGFRLGAAGVLAGWDEQLARPSGLDEVPLHWMDRTLSKYAGVENPAAWVDEALGLAKLCRSLEGLWVGLWHPNLVPALGFPGAPEQFERLVSALAADRPWFATLGQITSWRRACRSVRATRILPDGTPEMTAGHRFDAPLVLEMPDGRPATRSPWPNGTRG